MKSAREAAHDIQLGDRLSLDQHVMVATVDGRMIVLNAKTGTYLGTNELGAMILTSLRDGANLAAIAEAIASEYQLSTDIVQRDVLEYAAELLRDGIVVRTQRGVSLA